MAVTAVLRSTCRFAGLFVAIAVAGQRCTIAAPPLTTGQSARDFAPYNFTFLALPDGWSWRDPGPNAGDIIGQASMPANDEELVLKAYTVGTEHTRSSDAICADVVAMLMSRGTELTNIVKHSVVLDSVEGIRLDAEVAKPGGTTMHFVGFVGAKGGREFEFAYFTSRRIADVPAAADALLSRFKLIDPLASVKIGDLAEPAAFASPVYKYRVALPAGWSKPLPNPANVEADFTSHFADHSAVAVMPCLLVPTVKPDDAAHSIFALHGWDKSKITADVKAPGDRFTTFRATRTTAIGGRALFESAELWIGQGIAILVSATSTSDEAHTLTDQALKAIDVSGVIGSADPQLRRLLLPVAKMFAPTRPLRSPTNPRGIAQNELGVGMVRAGNYKDAADLFEISDQYQLDPQVTANWIDALMNDHQTDRAREVAVLATSRFPSDPLVIPATAALYRALGDQPALIALARSAIDAGMTDDGMFFAYANQLLDADQNDEAARLVASYKKRSHGPLVTDIEARALIGQHRPKEAIAILDAAIAETKEQHPLLRQSLVLALLNDKQLDRAGREIDRLAGEGVPARDVAICQGELCMHRGQFNEAKVAFEKAKSLGLDAREADQWISLATKASGQGKNATVRDAIEAIDMPADLFTADADAALDHSLGAAYRRSSTAILMDRNAPQRTTHDEVIEIYDQTGVESFSTIKLKLNPLYEKLFINAVEVKDEQGKTLWQGKPDDFYVLDASADHTDEDNTKAATREQTVNLPVSGLRPGCTLHLCSTRERLQADDRISFDEQLASHSFPVGENVIFITGDGIKRLVSTEFNGAKRIDRPDGVAWRFSNPPCIAAEPCLPDLNDFVPGFAFGDNQSTWRDEGLEYLQLIADRLRPDAAVAHEVKQLDLEGKPALERLHAIVRYVQSHCAYKAIAFGPRAYIPTPPGKIIEQRYGDCKDQALLIHLMLKEAGITSHLALARMEGIIYPEIASRDQFDHMIVNVPDCDGSWWIDTTNRDSEAIRPTPGPGLLGRHVLLLDSKTPELVALPAWDPNSTGMSTKRSLDIGEDGAISVVDHAIVRGLLAGYFRSSLHGSDAARRNEYAARMLGIDISTARSWSVKINALEEPWQPLTIDATYAPRQKLKKSGSRLVGEVPAPEEHLYLTTEAVETRRLPFQLKSMVNYDVSFDMTYPATWTPESLPQPEPAQFDSPFGQARLSFAAAATADGKGHWSGRLSVKEQSGVFPAAKYADFCQSRQAILDAWAVPLIFRTTP